MKITTAFYKFIVFSLVVSMSVMTYGCKDDETDGPVEPTLTVKPESVTLDWEGTLQTVTVSTNQQSWDVDKGAASWLTIEKQEKSFTVAASENPDFESTRSAEITVTAGDLTKKIEVKQLGKSQGVFKILGYSDAGYTSRNGRYFFTDPAYNEPELKAVVLDLQEDKVYIDLSNDGDIRVKDISDNGIVVADRVINHPDGGGEDGGYPMVYENGAWIDLQLPSDYIYGTAQAITTDGTLVVGSATKAGYFEGEEFMPPVTYPVVWRNKTMEVLPMSERNIYDEDLHYGAIARAVSGDGSIIIGEEIGTYQMMMWKDGEWDYVGREYIKDEIFKGTGFFGDPVDVLITFQMFYSSLKTSVSTNGKYIAGIYGGAKQVAESEVQITYTPFIYNVESDQFTFLTQFEDAQTGPVTNDGVLFFGTPYLERDRTSYVYNPSTGSSISVANWIKDEYNVIRPDLNNVTGISSNGNRVIGYSVTFDEESFSYSFENWTIYRQDETEE